MLPPHHEGYWDIKLTVAFMARCAFFTRLEPRGRGTYPSVSLNSMRRFRR